MWKFCGNNCVEEGSLLIAEGTFCLLAKRCKQSRCHIVVYAFDQEAIRQCIYQLHEVKEHVNLTKLLIRMEGNSDWDPDRESDNYVCVLLSGTR